MTVIGPCIWVATASTVLPASRNSVDPPGIFSATILPKRFLVSGSRVFLFCRFMAERLSAIAPPWFFWASPCFSRSLRSRRSVSAETCSLSTSSLIVIWPFSLRISMRYFAWPFYASFEPAKCCNNLHNTAFCGKRNLHNARPRG